jgi:two-component system, NarL family, response regulator LiaR
MAQKTLLRIVICDDNDLLRMGLAVFIESYADMVLVGEAETGEAAVELCSNAKPDVVLLDLNMALDGMSAVPKLKQQNPNLWIVLLTNEGNMERVQQALDAGAARYVPKTASTEQIVSAIRSVQRAS